MSDNTLCLYLVAISPASNLFLFFTVPASTKGSSVPQYHCHPSSTKEESDIQYEFIGWILEQHMRGFLSPSHSNQLSHDIRLENHTQKRTHQMLLVWKGATVSEPKEVCAQIFAPFLIDTAIEVHALIWTVLVHYELIMNYMCSLLHLSWGSTHPLSPGVLLW